MLISAKIGLADFSKSDLEFFTKNWEEAKLPNFELITNPESIDETNNYSMIILGDNSSLTKKIISKNLQPSIVITTNTEIINNTYNNVWVISHSEISPTSIKNILNDIYSKIQIEKYVDIIDNSQVGLYEIDSEGNFILANKYFLNLLGLETESELQKLNAFRPGISSNGKREKLREILFESEYVNNFEDNWVKRDKTLVSVKEKITTKKDSNGKIKGFVGTVEKIEHDSRNKNINNKIDDLKSTFLSQLSHEIRTPLNTIVNYLSLIQEEEKEVISKNWEYGFSAITNATNRIVRTIDLLAKMSEIHTGNYLPNFKKYDITDILDPIIEQYKYIAKNKGLELNYIKNLDDCLISIDKPSVEDIFINLIDNAIKYTNSGKVQVYVKKSFKNKISVTILDTGIGISKKYVKNLFKPFTQESTGYTRKFDGNGLGLALANEYCKLNNAQIFVTSEKNTGSNFTVIFWGNTVHIN